MKPVDPESEVAVRRRALHYLARRDYCSGELRDKLCGCGGAQDTVARVIGALQRERIVDDRRFTENFVSYRADRGQGPDAIARKLRTLALDAALIGELVEAGHDWVSHARRARSRKFGSEPPASHAQIQAQARFLRSRGFTVAQIRQALATAEDLQLRPEEEGCSS